MLPRKRLLWQPFSDILIINFEVYNIRCFMYKYLFWDVDGTVLDFLAAESCAIKSLFQKYNLGRCTDEMIGAYSQINNKYWRLLEKNKMTKKEILIGRFLEFFELVGVNKELAEDFNDDYQEELGEHIAFVKDAEEVLLEQKGKYILVAVTNGTKVAQKKKLSKSGLDKVFDAVFISEDVGFEKPNIEYFDYIFEKLGIENRREVLIIGDSLTSDMKGGFFAGIDTCWYNPLHKPNNQNINITYEIDELVKIKEILN